MVNTQLKSVDEYVKICIEMAFSENSPTVEQFENNLLTHLYMHHAVLLRESSGVLKPLAGEQGTAMTNNDSFVFDLCIRFTF